MPTPYYPHIKIVVIEDQEDVLSMLCNALKQSGLDNVSAFEDPTQALAHIEDNEPADLIICDWNMPKMTGLDLLKTIRQSKKDAPFLMMTGRSDVDSIMQAKEEGVTAYIRKPFSPQQLKEKLRKILGERF